MMQGKTESGFAFEIDEAALDDMELVDDLVEMSRGNNAALLSVLERLLGKEQKKRLYEHERGENGRVSKAKIMQDVTDIFVAIDPGKKS
jgi:hypothetical protein